MLGGGGQGIAVALAPMGPDAPGLILGIPVHELVAEETKLSMLPRLIGSGAGQKVDSRALQMLIKPI